MLFLAVSIVDAKKKKSSLVTIVHADSAMEGILVKNFEEDGFSEVDLDGDEETGFHYRRKASDPIKAVYIIPPTHTYLNGTVASFVENVDYRVRCKRKKFFFESSRVGFFHVSVWTKTKGKRQRRAIVQNNMILNAGMVSICGGTELCNGTSSCSGRNRVNFDCPPRNNCYFISDDAPEASEPLGEAVVVKTCDQFIDEVCKKFNRAGGKVDVTLDAHGGPGYFRIGMRGGTPTRVDKESDCYDKICMKLKDKIKTLTLYSCSVADKKSVQFSSNVWQHV